MARDEHLCLQIVVECTVLNVRCTRPQDCVQRNTWRWVTQHWHCWASSPSDVVSARLRSQLTTSDTAWRRIRFAEYRLRHSHRENSPPCSAANASYYKPLLLFANCCIKTFLQSCCVLRAPVRTT